MGGAIVTASVGGGAAGGVVIPEPQGASYASWPDFIRKEAGEVLAILRGNLSREKTGEPKSGEPAPGNDGPAVFAGLFSRDTFIIIAVLLALIIGVRLLR